MLGPSPAASTSGSWRRQDERGNQAMMPMMDGSCGPVMTVIAGLGGLLGLGLLGSLIGA
jgi:hypothetical protein